ncbi:MAG: GTPase Era [Rhodospirillales bacterium]|nr:GTPase Era [Rhodospirillales bacterium]
MTEPRFGMIALLGAPNVGKSTLVNALVGQKVAIVTAKVQTTRARLRGIAHHADAQMVLIDTPGVFAPRRRLDRAMARAAWRESRSADARCVLIDAARGLNEESAAVLSGLKKRKAEALCVINKIDRVRRDGLLRLIDELRRNPLLTDFFLISALHGDGLDELRAALADRCPKGAWHYPSDQAADVPLRMLAAECVREQAYMQLHQELPYDLATETVSWKDLPDGSARVDVCVLVCRPSQKPIVIGQGGQRIRSISTAARHALCEAAGCQVHLFVHVKVDPSWQDRQEHYDALGLEFIT